MPLYDLWYCSEDDSFELTPRDGTDLTRRLKKCRLVHGFEAENWEAAKQTEQDLLGFTKNPIRKLPGFVTRRVDSGATQFGDDWPGMFIRGDEAFHLAVNIKILSDATDKVDLGFEAKIASRVLLGIAKDIDRDVFVGGPRIWENENGDEEEYEDELPDQTQAP